MEKDMANNMIDINAERTVSTIQNNKNTFYEKRPSEHPVWALLVRSIPLALSFILFAFAASINASQWGSKAIQTILASAVLLGILGIVVFIPKKP
jgi:hypothetical protein